MRKIDGAVQHRHEDPRIPAGKLAQTFDAPNGDHAPQNPRSLNRARNGVYKKLNVSATSERLYKEIVVRGLPTQRFT